MHAGILLTGLQPFPHWLLILHLLSLSRPLLTSLLWEENNLAIFKCAYISVHHNSSFPPPPIFNPNQLPCGWVVKRGMSRECGWLSPSLVLGRKPRLLNVTQGFLLIILETGEIFITFSRILKRLCVGFVVPLKTSA